MDERVAAAGITPAKARCRRSKSASTKLNQTPESDPLGEGFLTMISDLTVFHVEKSRHFALYIVALNRELRIALVEPRTARHSGCQPAVCKKETRRGFAPSSVVITPQEDVRLIATCPISNRFLGNHPGC
jgi:hypothetical protein